MKTKTVKRYTCDYCSKGSFKRPTMVRHEIACFKNPNRMCPVCCNNPLHKPDWDAKGLTVSAVGEECPACLLALVIRANKNAGTADEDGPGEWVHYPKYKEELFDFRNKHPEPFVDPYATEEYAKHVESMSRLCQCRSGDNPCDGVLAGGLCDMVGHRVFDGFES